MQTATRFVLVATLAVLAVRGAAPAGEVTGSFRLAKQTFTVGEPILVEFTVTNGSATRFEFFEGGDYRGTLRQAQYSFRATDASGRDATRDPEENSGGLGKDLVLEPGESFRSRQLLNGWTRLLAPGSYALHCRRSLVRDPHAAPGSAGAEAPVVIEADLAFEVKPYSREALVAAVEAIERLASAPRDAGERFFGVPFGWALSALARDFEIADDAGGPEADRKKLLLAGLPTAWDDRLYLEHRLSANRNWLTTSAPEDLNVTLTVRNVGPVPLAHDLRASTLTAGDASIAGWAALLDERLREAKAPDVLAPGAVLHVTVKVNALLPASPESQLAWRLRNIVRQFSVRFRA